MDLTLMGRSFIYTRNNAGPSTEPCGTPDVTGMDSEVSPLTTTTCVRLARKSVIHDLDLDLEIIYSVILRILQAIFIKDTLETLEVIISAA